MDSNPDLDRFTSRRSTVRAPRGVVATSQPLASEAGVAVLRDGGNAFDAAVATAAVLNVVEPTSTGLGGDLFALYRTADGDVGAFRSCGGAPGDATLERVREAVAAEQDVDPEDAEMPVYGPQTITVPGTARGWERTVEELGELDLARTLEPAIEYATEGFPVSEIIADQWAEAASVLDGEQSRDAYLFDGDAPDVGESVTLPELGESLRRIAEEGADVVYEGDIADEIVETVQSRGGLLSHDDLASFEPEFVDPVSTTYGDAKIYELPPNNQGLIALEALNIAEELGAGEYPAGSTERIHLGAEAMKRAMVDGHHYITDPTFEDVPDLASKEYAAERAAEIDAEASSDVEIGFENDSAENADTVLLTVADEAGNVVSFINSRFKDFGSGIVAGDTGIALQNRGSSFSLDPDHPNRIEPGKRPFHTLIPGIATLADDDWAAFGVMAGYNQPQGHLQVLMNLLDDGMSVQEAIDFPRWRYQVDGQLAVEGRLEGRVQTKLARRGHEVRVMPPAHFGGGQIARNTDGVLSGGSDPRKDGSAVGF
ncbi:gamma-glutamyltransferase [Natronorubrum daqingense]|uniref:Gamma-glutamyltransferase n=1 Tax=Natronorubrum daqingense TaxID=588898 RepID=A0A1N7EUC3_9EURY|nr:gamma-glutamyltransferase [Natronorubrum daqingense]APX97711.1 gamma-glutamyltransferase [Natronorubrum daqingense]SIR91672.1 gamma-glutamyltransferase 2. Threonine peptidase. MEROPS family T03 [Natronorubrum daqingense]